MNYVHFDEIVGRKIGVDITTIVELGHRAFLTERLYLELSATNARVGKHISKHDHYKFDSLSGIFFGLGYYYPELRSHLFNL